MYKGAYQGVDNQKKQMTTYETLILTFSYPSISFLPHSRVIARESFPTEFNLTRKRTWTIQILKGFEWIGKSISLNSANKHCWLCIRNKRGINGSLIPRTEEANIIWRCIHLKNLDWSTRSQVLVILFLLPRWSPRSVWSRVAIVPLVR